MDSESSFWQHAACHPDDIALVDETGAAWTAKQLLAEANRIANGLRAMDIGRTGVAAALMPKCAQLVALSLATSQIGVYLVTLNPGMSLEQIRHILLDSEARVLVLHPACAREAVLLDLTNVTGLRKILVGAKAGWQSYAQAFGRCADSAPPERAAGALLPYTSGTTGPPRGVLRNWLHKSPEQMYRPLLEWFTKAFGVKPRDSGVHLCTCPLHYAGPLVHASFALHLGHAVVLMSAWHARLALRLIQKYRVTTTFMVPFQFISLLKLPLEQRKGYATDSLQAVVHGSAPCPLETKREMLDWWGDKIFECYGATEVGATVASPSEWRRFPGTVGRAMWPHAVKILDEHCREQPAGRVGTVYMRLSEENDFVYKGDPEKTRQGRSGEFVTVGDVGYVNEHGYLFLLDRKADVITCRGEHIYPAELENVLIAHPLVADCAAFGIPHTDWGEEVRMAVQLVPGSVPSPGLEQEILVFLKSRLGPTKCPRALDYEQCLPRDDGGKLRRRELRQPYWAGLRG